MNRQELESQIKKKKSVLCVGLDTDIDKVPKHLLWSDDPVFEFNKAIIDATHEYAVAYKPNLAFYESLGVSGLKSLKRTMDYLDLQYPELFTIADAKRGDIGNTSKMYAKAFFKNFHFDSVTVAPYMGVDSVKPFLEFEGKWVILLALTSNEGAFDFQFLETSSHGESKPLYTEVLKKSQKWATNEQLMFVIGATKANALKEVRKYVPNHFLLIPGVGAQGGSVEEVMQNGMGKNGPAMLINSSRSILYKSSGEDFADLARLEAETLQKKMEHFF